MTLLIIAGALILYLALSIGSGWLFTTTLIENDWDISEEWFLTIITAIFLIWCVMFARIIGFIIQ